ncbi:MAG: ATP-binding cassette domain-containing protein, partial [Rhodococcus sp. (in: high G+C Gram-positive bacteria)]|nr:ATP-binding cassette domain-containing protein [Rhodococcus sp. (in: high G+C Gram-positive bacteria)]
MSGTIPAISVRGLRKRYGDQQVLGGLDLSVPAGSVYALLGANGAGKTTAVRILTTLIPFDGGEVTVAGHSLPGDPQNVRRRISVTGQYAAVDTLLTGFENLTLLGELNHLGRKNSRRRAEELLDQFDLTDFGDKRAGDYSGGMLRRLDIAMSLVARPDVVFLDEPTTGLDPRSRHEMWSIVRGLTASGVTIFL